MDERIYFNRCTFLDQGGGKSTDFIDICRKQSKLSFDNDYIQKGINEKNKTPFKEVIIDDPLSYIDRSKFDYSLRYEDGYSEYISVFLLKLEKFLLNLDPNEKYFFSHSSGSDSRIISGLMANLRAQGKASFDNVLFYCWGRPEADAFKKIMKVGGWNNFIIFDDSKDDAFDVGDENFSVDGWNPYTSQMKFWGDINPKEYIFLSGAEGESFLKPYHEWVHARGFFLERGESVHRLSKIFKDVAFPFLTYDVLQLNMSIPVEWKNVKDSRISRDKIRTDLVGKLGFLGIQPDTAKYNFNFTLRRRKEMISLYEKSYFYRDCKLKINYDRLFDDPNGFESRAWSFAVTVYQKIFS